MLLRIAAVLSPVGQLRSAVSGERTGPCYVAAAGGEVASPAIPSDATHRASCCSIPMERTDFPGDHTLDHDTL